MSEKKKRSYACRDCVRRRTALCEFCVSTELPDGDVARPTYFLRRVIHEGEGPVAELAAELVMCLVRGESLSAARVDEYNRAVARGGNEWGQSLGRMGEIRGNGESVCDSQPPNPLSRGLLPPLTRSPSLPEGGLEIADSREDGTAKKASGAKKSAATGTGAKKKAVGIAKKSTGKAKQLQIQQAAGRLDSKRQMKNAAYAEIDRIIVQDYLAYADEPRPATFRDAERDT